MAEFGAHSAGYWMALVALLLATGLVAGLVAGLLGVGGGIVIVPVLYLVFEALGVSEAVRMHMAVGTSLATIVFTAIRSTQAHHRRGAVDMEILRGWAPALALGVLIGTGLAFIASGRALSLVFSVVALCVAAQMAFGRDDWRLGARPPEGAARLGLGTALGAISVLMGIGGGTLGVPLLKAYGVAIHRAVATAAGFGVVIAVPGVAGFVMSGLGVPARPPFSLGYVNLAGFALIVSMTVISAPWGARAAHAMNPRPLTLAFAGFLALTSSRMFLNAIA